MRLGYLCAGLGAAAVLLGNSRAEACSCLSNVAGAVWPRDGAVEAAVDTPLVLKATELDPVTATLVAEDGTVVELQERHRLVPPGEFSCAKFSYAFLTTATELAPSTRYLFTVRLDKEDDGGLAGAVALSRTVSFVTGTARRDPAPPNVGLSLFGVLGPESRERADTLLDLYVETDAVEPLFVLAQGEQAELVHDLDPLSTDRPFRVGFGVVECAALTILDATGTALADDVLCEPNKCARVDAVGNNDCGGESFPAVGWSTWQSLPEGCDREALLQNPEAADVPSELDVPALGSGNATSENTPLSPPAEEAGTAQPSQARAVGGCGLSGRSPRGPIFAGLGLLLAALVGTRARRRATPA